ncbi:MAG TPA: copper resistance CopC family protein [Rhodanobacteraceae bacterium]|nr:copper resistance CopC family protein [Rhodanobacteraceae bacterium]
MKPLRKIASPLSCLLAIAAFAVPTAAFAHAFPQRSEPAVGSTIGSAPSTVKIWFNSDLEPLFDKLVVKNAAGKVVSQGKAKVDANHRSLLEVGLAPLPPGKYHVYWHVTSKDGHHTEGDFGFTVSGH